MARDWMYIGGESHHQALRSCSLILSRYGSADRGGGVTGILGPTRLHYDRAVGSVRYMASVLDGLVEKASPPL